MNKFLPKLFTCALVLSYILTPRESYSQGTALIQITQESSTSATNAGSLPVVFTRSATIPTATSSAAPNASLGENAFDFGTTPGDYYVESSSPLDGLKNLSSFTITGWLNARSLAAGGGGNRILSWINNGGDGVDLVVQSNGSLRLGVDGWPDFSPAFSNANKVTANASVPLQNWVFFAVTYQSNGQVSFYFGNNANNATLDVTRTYTAPGVTGSNIGPLALGAFNSRTRNPSTWDRMFRGVLDDLRIYGSVLSVNNIVAVQRSTGDVTPPSAPTNLRANILNPTTIDFAWDASTDNTGVTGYEILDDNIFMASVGNVTSHTFTELNPNHTYKLMVRAKDAVGNFSPFSAPYLINTTGLIAGDPLVSLYFDDMANGTPPTSNGTVQGLAFTTGTGPSNTTLPGLSLETPPNVGGARSLDFGVTPGNAFVESQNAINELKNLNAFTITGWLNCKSNIAGSGGNRIVSWINNGGEGVDLVYQSDGSLRLGVDGWPDFSPAFSNPGKVTTNASGPQSNWVFFAVTYQSNGQVQYYFGTNAAKATLDATKSYPGPGVTGSNIGKFAIGAFNSATRNAGTYDRMFRGLIDDVKVFNSVLPLSDIIKVQGKASSDITPPTVPGNFMTTGKSVSTVSLSWTASTDSPGPFTLFGYKLYNNGNIIAHLDNPGLTSYVLTGLTPATTYNLTLKAVDHAGNLSAATNVVAVTTDASGLPLPIIDAKFEESTGSSFMNEGIADVYFSRSPFFPIATTNVPNVPRDLRAADFGTAPANYYVYSGSTIGELAGLSSFTLTGWLNTRSNTTGAGGNRIMSWLRPNGEGVELVYQSDGSLRLGVDEPAGATPAVSTAGKVTTDSNAGATNWVFFAVTYQQSTGQVQYYFGNNTSDATLDVTKSYPGRGNVGGNIGPLTFGAFNNEAGTDPIYDRMFRGIIDNFRIYESNLSLADIRAVQHAATSDLTLPSAPSGLAASENTGTSVKLTWTSSTDNVAVVGYNIFNGSTLMETSVGPSTFVYLSGLTPGTTYDLSVRARDAAGNLSAPAAISVKAIKVPLIYFGFSGEISSLEYNGGTLGQRFIAASQVTNTPRGGGRYALSGFVRSLETDYIFDGLKNLSSFTIAGWVNRTSNSSNESIFTWMPNGSGDGVDLIVQPDGSLRLGVDGVATSSPAFSNANKITTNSSASFDNWTFFAVTYQAGGQAQFYFGNNTVSASLDKSVIYSAPGNTGSNIGPVSIKSPVGGVIDSPILYGSVLTLEEIRALQFGPEDNEPPTSPGVLTSGVVATTYVGLAWSDISTDNFGVASYDVFDGSTMLYRYVPTGGRYDPNPQDATVYPLTPGTTYHLYVKARDSWGNYSAPTNTVTVTTLIEAPSPLVWLKLDEDAGYYAANSGAAVSQFGRSPGVPAASDNVPTGNGSIKSADYGTSSANAYVESTTPINELKNLGGFTITGWLNNRSSVMGSGGNRIASWVNNGGEGVDLVYKNNGALQLGVDQWPDFSPAISSPNKVTTNASAPASNWVFFAVTYTESGSVQFYFGTTAASATLDVTKSYPGRGAVGSNIAKLAIGNFNDATRNSLPAFDRVFRGMIDDIRIYGSVLTQQQIVQIQGFVASGNGRMAMTPEPTINDETADLPVLTQNYPNPFESGTTIEVNIPHSVRVARITVSDITGRSMQSIEIEGRGPTSVGVSAEGLNSGVYIYTLMTDGKVVGFKRMMVRK